MNLTCVEEGRNGHTANQVLQEQALSSNENGYKCRQGIMEGQVANLKDEKRKDQLQHECFEMREAASVREAPSIRTGVTLKAGRI